ncbi:MAG: PQQ-dependent sugar dehydrogenase [Vicinamibacterales bacterium]|jgi:glucose/arabinose dehydrogenase/alkylhydroperoxidase family enzyme|nr:PQQ-dependent sugar dehydrogenase [Vicinamibacterales bacterium]MDP7479684.1 PQQ-dependent sugar dehydrogenase [Vicinamibacterales bacterium]HJN46763.1 PQQ-dependent sugar dehydrogenase [Vicinamibacterales bacterium]
MSELFPIRHPLFAFTLALALVGVSASAQRRDGVPALPPPDAPVVLNTAEVPRIRVVPVAGGLSHPWGMAFRQNGDILVTERDRGTLRVVRNGQLLDRDIPGVPEVFADSDRAGLMDVAVHPDDDRIVYLTYSKAIMRNGQEGVTVALARGRLDSGALTEIRDIFVADGLDRGIAASRLIWAADGKLFMTVGGSYVFADTGSYAQDPSTHFGKLMRLNDDGTAADDNPFVGNADYLPEIYSMGHRNQLGLAFHPETGDLWATENGPQGGDEANIIKRGENYGWPRASYSREYSGVRVTDTPWLAEFEQPEVLWWPSIAPSGLAFYTGEQFPAWQGNLFVGSMMVGRMIRTGHVERIVFNGRGEEIRREWLLTELKQRIRDIRQGLDGYLYVLTEEDDAVLLRIEPAHAIVDAPGSTIFIDRLTETRVPPLPESDWTDEQRELVEKYARGGAAGNALRTLIRVPALADRFMPLLTYVSNDSTLSPRHRAILILRTAWLTQNGYLWAAHAGRSDHGLTAEEVRQLAEGPGEGWTTFERVLIGLADEMFRNSSVTDRTWAELSRMYDLPNLADAVVTVSETTASSIVFNTLGIQPDVGAAELIPSADVAYRIDVPAPEPALTTPRIEPIEGDGIRVGRTLRQHPQMEAQWYANPSYVQSPERSRMTPHDRELLILRTGWNAQSVYEWAKHVGSVGRARDRGLEPLWIAQGNDASGWNATERALIDAADEMYRDTMISDETWAALSEDYDTHQLMSIAAIVARYRKVSMTLNALGVQPLPDDEGFPELEGY